MQFYEVIKKYVDRALTAVRLPFRGKLTRLDVKAPIQLVQGEGLSQEQLQSVELIQQFGFTSGVPAGAQIIALPLGGKTVNAVIVATEHGSFRVRVEDGETAIYNQWGAKIVLKKEKSIEIDCETFIVRASKEVKLQTPMASLVPEEEGSTLLRLEGDMESTGAIVSEGDQAADGISLTKHIHRGVEPGGGETAPPAAE